MLNEIWKDIPGYEGRYQASNLGYVRSLNCYVNSKVGPHTKFFPGRILKPSTSGPYLMQTLTVDGISRSFTLHNLIAMTFLGPRPIGQHIRHLDGKVNNNRLDNLKYGTVVQNGADAIKHGTTLKGSKNSASILNEQQVLEIKKLLSSKTLDDLAYIYGVSKDCICKIKTGKNWGWLKEIETPCPF